MLSDILGEETAFLDKQYDKYLDKSYCGLLIQ